MVETRAKDHQKEIELFSAKARASDGDLSAYAQKTVPVLNAHLEQARDLSRTLVASAQTPPPSDRDAAVALAAR